MLLCSVLHQQRERCLRGGAVAYRDTVIVLFRRNGEHRDLHRVVRRQRHMCIRDRFQADPSLLLHIVEPVYNTHLRAHDTPEHLVCRLLLEKKKPIRALPHSPSPFSYTPLLIHESTSILVLRPLIVT